MTACGDGVSLPSGVRSTSVDGQQACQFPLLQHGANTALMRDTSRGQTEEGTEVIKVGERLESGSVDLRPRLHPMPTLAPPAPLALREGPIFHRQSSLAGYSPWGHSGSDTTEHISTHIRTPVRLG